MRSRPSILPVVLLVACPIAGAPLARAQEPEPATEESAVRSGPESGKVLTPVGVYAPVGPRAGLEFDAAEMLGDGPGALLFVHELTRNVAPLIRGLDELGSTHRPLGLSTFTIRLAADRSDAERHTVASSRSLRMTNPMVVSVDGAEGPGDYALNRKCTLTLVVTKGGRVHKSIGLTDTGRQDLGLLRRLVEEVTGPLPDDPGALRRAALDNLPADPEALRQLTAQLSLELSWMARMEPPPQGRNRMNDRRAAMDRNAAGNAPGNADAAARAPERKREGQRPSDTQLEALLRRVIRQDADDATIAGIFEQIDQRVDDDDGLRNQAVEMFKLMLSLEYGGATAKERARNYVREHGPKR